MFSIFRSFARSPIAKVMIAFLVVGLTAYALPNLFSSAKPKGLISAGDRYVLPSDVERKVNLYVQNLQQSGQTIPTRQEIAQSGLLSALLNQMTSDTAQLAYMDSVGIQASKFALADQIKDAAIFKNGLTGEFDAESYRSYAVQQSGSVERFESDFRDDITVGYMQAAVSASIDTPNAIARTWMLAQSEQRDISFVRIPVDTIDTSVAATDEELQAFYADNKEIFRQPERRSATLLQISTMDYLDRVEIPEADLRAHYERSIKDYSTPEVRTILQFVSPDRAVVQEAVDRIGTGEDRDVVARELAATITTRSVTEDDLTNDLYNRVVFSSEADLALGPLQINEEWYAAVVTDIQAGTPHPFESVSDAIHELLATRKAETAFTEAQETFFDLVGGGFSLEEIAQEIGVPALSFMALDRRGRTEHGVSPATLVQLQDAIPTLFDLAFNGEQSDVLEQGADTLFVVRLDTIEAEHTPEFEEVASLVQIANESRLIDTRLDTSANELLTSAQQSSLEEAATAANLVVEKPMAPLTRRAVPQNVSRSMAAQVFAGAKGDIFVATEPTGDRVVIQIEDIRNLSDAELQTVMSSGKAVMEDSIVQDLNASFLEAVYQTSRVQQNSTSISDFVSSMAGE